MFKAEGVSGLFRVEGKVLRVLELGRVVSDLE